LEKSWQQRETSVSEKEEDWARLKKEVDEFPGRLKREIDKAAADAAKSTEDKLEREMVLIKKDGEAEKRVAGLQIQSLENTLARQSAEIEMLHKQLEEAKRQVQDIAVKAIEGASGAKAGPSSSCRKGRARAPASCCRSRRVPSSWPYRVGFRSCPRASPAVGPYCRRADSRFDPAPSGS
jgi:hypothetical protein